MVWKFRLAKEIGYNALVTMQSWMFLSSFEKMRKRMLREKTIKTMAHLGARAFGSISGEVVQTTVFVLKNSLVGTYRPTFFRLLEGDEYVKRTELVNGEKRFESTAQDEFKKIPGSPVAYWVSERMFEVFNHNPGFESVAPTRKGMVTARNHLYVRRWYEVSVDTLGFDRLHDRGAAKASKLKWFSYLKGGGYRKWFGNKSDVINWENDGFVLQHTQHPSEGRVWATNFNLNFIFKKNVNWGAVTSSEFSARLSQGGELFDAGGSACFPVDVSELFVLGFLNSKVTKAILTVLNPTLNFQAGNVANLPLIKRLDTPSLRTSIDQIVNAYESDWNAFEHSWDFQSLPILTKSSELSPTLESGYAAWITENRKTIATMKCLEEENNRLFIDAYGLADELTADVLIEQITLTVNPAYRYGGNIREEEQWTRFRRDSMAELVSYAIGCMMGRYSLDAPGIIYAHSGNMGSDAICYTTFPADSDGLVPLTDREWFDDDATNRLVEFMSVAWDVDHLENNLTFLADSLAPRRSESSRDTIRRYLCDTFYKNHLQTYKNRPIYWLFTSGKCKAFQCLVYLHRYNEGTLARMRTECVVPLQGMIASRVRQLEGDIAAATSTARRRKLEKERGILVKQQTELREFDEKLRHYADRRIALDLDDGVKVNYGKFGDLLAAVTNITGKKAD